MKQAKFTLEKAPESREIRTMKADLCVVGGAGHVGLPLAIVFASKGLNVLAYDINESVFGDIRGGRMPFMEEGGDALLQRVLKDGRLTLGSNAAGVADADTVIITIGTPVDEFMNPDTMKQCVDGLLPHLSDRQLIVLRSTVYAGTTQWLDKYLRSRGKKPRIAFCPERVVQGHMIDELQKLPQIVSGTTPEAEEAAARLFETVAPEIVRLSPLEAEFAKLFNNAYRYIQFAITNQFFMIANTAGLDYARILAGMKKDYPRAADIPGAGFAAGPCLYKDTMQLAASMDSRFTLGNAAVAINEGLVWYLVGEMRKKYDLEKMTVGLLGMAFKANSDDTRASLSYKLKRTLSFYAKEVLTTDPHVTTDASLKSLDEVIGKSDLLVLCAPHAAYRELDLKGKSVIDIWGFFGQGARV